MLTQGITFNAIKNFLQTTRQSKISRCFGTCHVTLECQCDLSSHSILEALEMATIPWTTVCASSSFVQHVRFSQVQPAISTHSSVASVPQLTFEVSPKASKRGKKKKEIIVPNELKGIRLCYNSVIVCVYILYMYNAQYTHSHTKEVQDTMKQKQTNCFCYSLLAFSPRPPFFLLRHSGI